MRKLFALLVTATVLAALGIGITAAFRNDARARSGEPTQDTQETIVGEPGAPGATRLISGQQLPAPPSKFGGVIETTTDQSKPYWPPRVAPRPGAPNVLQH